MSGLCQIAFSPDLLFECESHPQSDLIMSNNPYSICPLVCTTPNHFISRIVFDARVTAFWMASSMLFSEDPTSSRNLINVILHFGPWHGDLAVSKGLSERCSNLSSSAKSMRIKILAVRHDRGWFGSRTPTDAEADFVIVALFWLEQKVVNGIRPSC